MLKVTATLANIIAALISLGLTVAKNDEAGIVEMLRLLDSGAEVEVENRDGKMAITAELDVAAQAEHFKAFVLLEDALGFKVVVTGRLDKSTTLPIVHNAQAASRLPTALEAAMNDALEKKERSEREIIDADRRAEEDRISARAKMNASLANNKAAKEAAELAKLDAEVIIQAQAAKIAAAAAVKADQPWYSCLTGTTAKVVSAAVVVGAVGYYGWKFFSGTSEE